MDSKLVICAVCLLLAISTDALAASLTVTGALFEEEVSPGDHISHEITLSIGETDKPTDATAGIFGYGLGTDGAKIALSPDEDISPYSASEFLIISPKNVTFHPGEGVVFVIEGDVPKDVGSGGRYAIASIDTAPQGSGPVGIALAAIAPIRLTIAGTDLIETGVINELSFSEYTASVLFENTGNHHYGAFAEAYVKDGQGEVVATASSSSDKIIPTFSRLFNAQFDQGEYIAPGSYIVEVKVIKDDGTVLDTEETIFEV